MLGAEDPLAYGQQPGEQVVGGGRILARPSGGACCRRASDHPGHADLPATMMVHSADTVFVSGDDLAVAGHACLPGQVPGGGPADDLLAGGAR